MKVQTFFLTKSLDKIKTGIFNAEQIGIHSVYPLDDKFPFLCKIPYYLLIASEKKLTNDTCITLKFELNEECGVDGCKPSNGFIETNLKKGYRFFNYVGSLELQFPKYGEYTLKVTLKSGTKKFILEYFIDCEKPNS